MDRTRTLLALVAGGSLALAIPALAEEPEQRPSHEMAAVMKAYMEAGTPGEPHAFLGEMAGEWEGRVTMWMDPSAPPLESTFTSSAELIMGGRFLLENVEGDFMGLTFEGAGVLGHNNTTGQYEPRGSTRWGP